MFSNRMAVIKKSIKKSNLANIEGMAKRQGSEEKEESSSPERDLVPGMKKRVARVRPEIEPIQEPIQEQTKPNAASDSDERKDVKSVKEDNGSQAPGVYGLFLFFLCYEIFALLGP